MSATGGVTSRASAAVVGGPGRDDGAPLSPDVRLGELADIMSAYNNATQNLQRSHEALANEVVRLQRELASTDAQLQRSKRLAALGEMAAGIAHEIRNPLAAIRLYSQLLEDDLSCEGDRVNGREEAADTARKIGSVVRGLNGIVTDVLTFAREIKPRKREVEASVLFDRAVEAQRPALDSASVLVHRPDRAGRVVFDGDLDLLQQAMVNLIRNAADAMREQHGSPRELTLDARSEDGLVVLTVRDSGPGIASDDVDRIFNPFFTTRNTGTGLGLAIVHRIIDAHSGTIDVRNEGGAVFELSIPVGQSRAEGVGATSARSQADHERTPLEYVT